jgi:hypothetical protein
MGTATTAADGSFSLPPVTPSENTFYRVEWPGATIDSTVYPPAVAVVEVFVGYPSNLTLTPSNYVVAGDSPLLLGRLTAGTKPLPGQSVTLESSPAGLSNWTVVDTAVTSADGTYSLTATPITAATDYRAAWDGGEVGGVSYTPAAAATATTGIGDVSTVTLGAKAKTILYGASTGLSGTLLGGTTPLAAQPVLIQSSLAGTTTWKTVGTVTSGSAGTFSKTVSPKANTVYRAVWLGGELGGTAYASAAATAKVDVKPKITLKMLRYVSKVGSYFIYRYGSRVVMKGAVTPNHYRPLGGTVPGKVTVKAYKRTYSSTLHKYVWKLSTTSKRSLSTTSVYKWSWLPKSRGSYRLRAYFAGDTNHVASNSPFRYMKVK